MFSAQDLAFFYLAPIALWLALLAILVRVWWSGKLEDSLAYLVFLRERKLLFVSLLVALTLLHVGVELVNIVSTFESIGGTAMLAFGLGTTTVGALIVFLFAWLLLRRPPKGPRRSLVLDLPDHLAYSLGALDRAESGSGPSPPK